MSVLEHIRKRPALVITILGFALLLFLFTGIDSVQNLFTDHETAAKVDGEKIKIQTLNARADQMRENLQRQGRDDVDYGRLQQEQLQSMVNEVLIDKEIERLGIEVTDAELENLFFGANALPYFTNVANNYGFETAAEMYNYAYSNNEYADQVRSAWEELENNAREEYRMQKFMSLFGAIAVNKLDAKAYYDDNATSQTVVLAHQDISTLPDDQFPVSDAEISDRYKETKELYAIPTEQALVDYIQVKVTPSQADYLAAQQEVEDAIVGLKSTPSTDAIADNFNFKNEIFTGRQSALTDTQIKNNFDKLTQDTVVALPFSADTYTILKLIDSYEAQDSVYLDIARIDANASTDSVIAKLNAGVDPATMANEVGVAENIGISLIAPENASYKDKILAAEPGQFFLLEAGQQGQPSSAVKVVRKLAPARIYEVAKISRAVEPSSATYNNLNEALRTYLADNKTIAQFKENAPAANYFIQEAIVNPSMLSFAGLPSSSAVARWAMENEKGAISEVFTDDTNTYLLALAIEDIYKDYLPASNSSVTLNIATNLRAEKKADKLVADYKDKANSVNGYAELMKVKPDTVNVIYGQEYVRGFFPGDPDLLANIAVAKEGELVGPFAAKNGVVVFQVTGNENHGREFDYKTDAASVRQREISGLQQHLQDILRANKKVSYKVQRFFGNN